MNEIKIFHVTRDRWGNTKSVKCVKEADDKAKILRTYQDMGGDLNVDMLIVISPEVK